MTGDQDIGECQQTAEDVIENDMSRAILEEEILLLLVDVEAKGADLPALESGNHRARVQQSASACIDEHHAVAHSAERLRLDEVIRLRS